MIDLRPVDEISLADLREAAGGNPDNETDVLVTQAQALDVYEQLQETVRYEPIPKFQMTNRSMQWHAIRIYTTQPDFPKSLPHTVSGRIDDPPNNHRLLHTAGTPHTLPRATTSTPAVRKPAT